MNKRIILKTVLICIGIFILILTAGIYFFNIRYEIDNEVRHAVYISSTDIHIGDIITGDMVSSKIIKASALTPHMTTEANKIIGTKAQSKIPQGEYIYQSDLISKPDWYKQDERIITLLMDINTRHANLIKKGSWIDLKVDVKDSTYPPLLVLSKIFVEDILDENGLSLGSEIGSKKAYAKVILNHDQRDRFYVASKYGNLLYELYCDNTQKPIQPEFNIKDFANLSKVLPQYNTALSPASSNSPSESKSNPQTKEGNP